MKTCSKVLFVLLPLLLIAIPASAVTMQFNAAYSLGEGVLTVDGNPYVGFPEITYNAYYDSDDVITTLTGIYDGLQGYTQSVSLTSWDMALDGTMVIQESGGSLQWDNSVPTAVSYLFSDGGLIWNEMAGNAPLDLTAYSTTWLGAENYTYAAGTILGDIESFPTAGVSGIVTISEASVPEPATILLLISSIAGLYVRRKK